MWELLFIYTETTVLVPPELEGPSGRMYVMEDSQIAKSFKYRERFGLPPPHSYRWLHNGNPFDGNIRVSLQDGNKTLSVKDASRADTGNYTITVLSESGQASLQLDLHITCNDTIHKTALIISVQVIPLSRDLKGPQHRVTICCYAV